MRSQRLSRRGRNQGNPVMRVVDVGAGVTLSPHLVGMHFHRWPEGSPLSPAPTYGFGTVRSHDYAGGTPGTAWNKVHTGAGAYNWASLDVWINTHHVPGRRTLYTLYGTPSWLASTSNPDPYGNPGGSSSPSDGAAGFPALQAFITAMVNRYNDGTQGGRKLAVIEVWNEPKYNGVYTDFWAGTAAELVDMARAIRLGVNASVDPGVKVFSPGFSPNFGAGTTMDVFLATESIVQPGTYGRDWIDELAVHVYAHGYTAEWANRIESRIAEIDATIARYPSIAGIKWNMTEQGGAGSTQDPNPQSEWTDYEWGMNNARYIIYQGLLGAQSVCLYSHDGTLSGDYTKPEFADPLNRVHAEVAGKTITQAYIRKNGVFDLIADGRPVRI